MDNAFRTSDSERDRKGAPVPPSPRQPLRIETQHEDRTVVLGCDSCDVTVALRTSDGLFAAAVQAFFERHAGCTAPSIDLTG